MQTQTTSFTERWLTENYTALTKVLAGYLRKRLPLSADRDMIEDHISQFMCELLAKDTLASLDDTPTIQGVCYLALNSARNDIRTLSKDPWHKLNYAGVTEAEMKKIKEGESAMDFAIKRNETLSQQITCASEETAGMSAEDILAYEEHINAFVNAVASHYGDKEAKRERALRVLNLMMDGYGNREIAKVMGVTNSIANKMVLKVRAICEPHRLALA